ncbi:MAG: MarR family winged helix-turn-helix transcriptional regulator [Thermoleophilaceae bacterium]
MQASVVDTQGAIKPENEDIVHGLGTVVHHIMRTCSGGVLEAVDRLGLSLSQLKALTALTGSESLEMSLKEIGDVLGLSLPAVSRAVDGLVQRDLVTRTEDPLDRRSKRVAATASGRALLDELSTLRLVDLEQFVETLTPEQRELLTSAVTAIAAREDIKTLPPRKD